MTYDDLVKAVARQVSIVLNGIDIVPDNLPTNPQPGSSLDIVLRVTHTSIRALMPAVVDFVTENTIPSEGTPGTFVSALGSLTAIRDRFQ
ncbi:MAG: hypothetical protein ACKOXK_03975 [Chakrabartia sp.]